MIQTLKSYNIIKIFFPYCILILILTGLQRFLLINDQVFYNSFSEQLDNDRIEQMLDIEKRWQWLTIGIVPIIYFIKFLLISCCIYTATILFYQKLILSFSTIFKIVILSDIIFFIPIILKIIWFIGFHQHYTLENIQRFSPLSILNLFDDKAVDALWVYPLQSFNLFEVIYLFVLAFWLSKFSNGSYDDSLGLVLYSYVPGLLIWVVFVMFLTVTLNPQI